MVFGWGQPAGCPLSDHPPDDLTEKAASRRPHPNTLRVSVQGVRRAAAYAVCAC
ncbi:MAG: hypothetical protein AB1457_16105 [Chloroflexota bacterium]